MKGIAESKLSGLLGQQVRIGDLKTNLLSRLELRDFRILQAGPGDTIPLLSLGQIRIEYSLVDLLGRPPSIRSVSLDELFLSVSRDSAGVFNTPLLASDEKEDSVSSEAPLPVRLNRALLRNASIRYLDGSIPAVASVHNLNVTLQQRMNDTYLYDVRADSSVLEYQSVPLTAAPIELKGQISLESFVLTSLSIGLPGLQFTGNGEFLQKSDPPSVTGDFLLTGNPGLLVQTAGEIIGGEFPSVKGDVDLALHLEGSLDRPRLGLQLDLPGLEVADIQIRDGSIQAELEPGSISLNQMNLGVLGGSISGKGRLSTDSLLSGQITVSVKKVDLAQVWQYLYKEASPHQGKINAQLTGSGSGRDPKNWNLLADVNLKQAKYRSKSIPDLSAKLNVQQGLADFRFSQENSELSAKLKLDDRRLEGKFSGKILQLEPLAGLADISELTGSMELQGILGGSLDSPSISAQAKTNNLRYQDFPVDSLFASVIYLDGRVHISELHFEGRLDSIDTLRPPFHLSGISGAVAYRGDVGGRPDSLGGEISVDLIRPGYGNIRFDEGRLRARLEGQRIDLSLFQLRRDSLLIQAQADFSLPTAYGSCEIELIQLLHDSLSFEKDKPILVPDVDDSTAGVYRAGKLTAAFDLSKPDRYTVNMEGDQLNLQTIRHILAQPPDIGGWLGFDLTLARNMDSPEVDFDFHLSRPRFQMVEMDSVKGHLALAEEQFAFQPLEIYHKGHHSTASGVVELQRNQDGAWSVTENNPVRGQASGQALDLRLLEPFLPGEMQVSGYASYDLTWDGKLRHPHPAGTLLLEDGAVQTAQNVPPIEKIDLNASIQDSVLNVVNLSGEIQNTPFQLQGNLTLSQSRNLDVEMSLSVADFGTVTGDGILSPDSLQFQTQVKQMDMATLHPFFPDLARLAGTLNTEVILSGSTEDPELDGHLEIRGLTVQPDWMNLPFDQSVVKLEFNKNKLEIDSVFMRLAEGVIFVSGSLTHDQGELTHADVRVNVSDVTIDRPKELILSVKSAQLSYKDHNGYFLLDGDIILDESRVLVNFKPQSVLPFARAVERPPQQLPQLLQKTRVNVRLRESEEVWVDNNLARLRMHTELAVIGSPTQPNLTGRVSVEEGYVLYLDRKFKIKRGVVDFIDPDKLNPIIDLRAETTVKTYRATEAIPYLIALTVTGPLDEVVVDLSSDPPEDKSNIISLLTIGATREELAGKDGEGKGASSALLERAQSLSSQKIAGYTSRKVGSLLGLDQFTIEGNLFSRDRSAGPQLLASKKISPRAELTYTTTVGHSNENSFRLDYRLSKHFFLEGQTDQQGRAGMNLKYRLRSR